MKLYFYITLFKLLLKNFKTLIFYTQNSSKAQGLKALNLKLSFFNQLHFNLFSTGVLVAYSEIIFTLRKKLKKGNPLGVLHFNSNFSYFLSFQKLVGINFSNKFLKFLVVYKWLEFKIGNYLGFRLGFSP